MRRNFGWGLAVPFVRPPVPVWPFPPIPVPAVLVEATFAETGGDPAAFAAAGIALPEALAAAVPARRASYLAGRLAAREALGRAGAETLDVGRDEAGAPRWPAGYLGSISHAGTLVGAVAVRREAAAGIGFDVEPVMERGAAGEVADLVLVRADRLALANLRDLPEAAALTLAFSLKESLYKALYPTAGAFIGFEDAELAAIGAGRARLRLRRRLAGGLPEGMEIDAVYALDGGMAQTLAWLPA